MQVTFTNLAPRPVYLSALYLQLLPGESVTARRTAAQLDAEQELKRYVQRGIIQLGFSKEYGDDAETGVGISPLGFTISARPAATAVPPFTSIWISELNALIWSDGENWRDASGALV
jgi:hypothetical protein